MVGSFLNPQALQFTGSPRPTGLRDASGVPSLTRVPVQTCLRGRFIESPSSPARKLGAAVAALYLLFWLCAQTVQAQAFSAQVTPAVLFATFNVSGYCLVHTSFGGSNCQGVINIQNGGSLVPAEFMLGGTTYTVWSIAYFPASFNSSALQVLLSLDQVLPEQDLANLSLVIGTETYLFSEATVEENISFRTSFVPNSSGAHYSWIASSAPWTVGTAVGLSIVAAGMGGDVDDPTIVLGTTDLELNEGDAAEYTVHLSQMEAGGMDVTVQITLAKGSDLTVSPSTLTFTSADFDQDQLVTVTAREDDDWLPVEKEIVTHSASGGGSYDGVSAELEVSIMDNETNLIYVERNGAGNCTYEAPCAFPDAVQQLEASGNAILVRLASEDGRTRIYFGGEVSVGSDTFIGTYVEDGDSASPAEGVVVVEGTLDLGATVTAMRGTMLRIESDRIILKSEASGIMGAVELGPGDQAPTITGGSGCLRGSLGKLLITGDVEVIAGDGCQGADAPRMTIRHSLTLREGHVLDMGDVELEIAADFDSADEEFVAGELVVQEDTRIEGRKPLLLNPEEETGSGDAADGYANTSQGCFSISGAGSIDMDIVKMGQGGVCVSLAEIGDGGVSKNRGGTLLLTGTTQFDGTFRNLGRARTEFWKLEQLTEELEILGEDPFDSENVAGNVGGSDVTPPEFCDGFGTRSGASGVYFYSPVRIFGGVFLVDTDNSSTDCAEGLHFMGDSNPVMENDETPNREELVSTVFGAFSARGNSRITLDSHNFHHNLAVEDDILVEDRSEFSLASPAMIAPDAVSYRGESLPDHVCGFDNSFAVLGEAPSAYGNKVILSGELNQDFRIPRNARVEIGSVQIDKTSASAKVTINERIPRGTLFIENLEIRSGVLVTNGILDMSDIDLETQAFRRLSLHDAGALDKGSAEFAYKSRDARPAYIRYVGSRSVTTRDELLPPLGEGDSTMVMVLPWLEIFKSQSSTVTLAEDVIVGSRLGLYSGTLGIAKGKDLFLFRNILIEYGSGDLDPDSGGDTFFLPGRDYLPHEHGIRLDYAGIESRGAGTLWRATESLPGSGLVQNVRISSRCGPAARPVIALNPGYSGVARTVVVAQGALDLAGNDLAVFGVAAERGGSPFKQRVFVGAMGSLCDSVAGVLCSLSPGKRTMADESEVNRLLKRALTETWSGIGLHTFSGVGVLKIGPEDDAGMRYIAGPSGAAYSRRPEAGSSTRPVFRLDLTESVVRHLHRVREHAGAAQLENLRTSLERLNLSRASDARSVRAGGAVHMLGNVDTLQVIVITEGGVKNLPGIVVDKSAGRAILTASGVEPEGTNANVDIVNVFSLKHDGGTFEVSKTVDRLQVITTFEQSQGQVQIDTLSVRIGSDNAMGMFRQTGGSFVTSGDVDVYGSFVLDADSTAGALFNLNGRTHTVVGDFWVGGGFGEENVSRYMHGNGCGDEWLAESAKGETIVMGNYNFAGVGECLSSGGYDPERQGLSGTMTFMGDASQRIWLDGDPEAQFASVVIESVKDDPAEAILLKSPVVQNAYGGTLTLRRGVIEVDTVDIAVDWTVQVLDPEFNLVNSNVADSGSVLLGSRGSYVRGLLTRSVKFGSVGGGTVSGGYVFPVGSVSMGEADERVSVFRPLILQFPTDLGPVRMVTVGTAEDLAASDLAWPEEGLVVDAYNGSTLTLDAISDLFWMVSMDQVLAQDANVRIAVSDLPNVYDYRGLRLVQWDCDRTSPRLAGLYDLGEDGTDAESFAATGYIEGMLNVTQSGVQLKQCSIFGIASNFLQNPISLPPQRGGLASVQYIQNVADTPIDVYVDGNRVGNDWGFPTATRFVNVVHGEHTIDVVSAADADNSTPLVSETVRLLHGEHYIVILHGDASEVRVRVVDGVPREAGADNSFDFFIAHGARQLGPVDVRLIDPTNNSDVIRLLANNLAWDDVGRYIRLAPSGYNVEITTASNDRRIEVYRMELDEYREQSFVLNLSGRGKSSAEGLSLMGVEQDGSLFFPSVITSVDTADELPSHFELTGNYPNPFKASTRILFDLPEPADVTIEIMDMLGRQVLRVPLLQLEAGANRAVEVDALHLASGAYIYRIIAKSVSGTSTSSARMVKAR